MSKTVSPGLPLRVRLDELRMEHLDALCAVGLDPLLWKSTTIAVTNREDMYGYIQKALREEREGTAKAFVIVEIETGTVIGTTRFHHISPENRRLEIGFTWIAPAWQRRGLNSESKVLMLIRAFEEMNCMRVELKADAENYASRAAIEAIGGKQEAIFRNYMLSERRGPRDLAVYSILDTEWPGVKSGLLAKVGAYLDRG